LKSVALAGAASAALLLTSGPANTQPASPAVSAPAATTSAAQPLWFRSGVDNAAVTQLIDILKRAPFDGFSAGTQLAAQVQAAVTQAHSGNPADLTAAEQALSAAWVQYVQAIRRPTPHMIYAYAALKPQDTSANKILQAAAAAPSLQQYLVNTANLNPDPRLLANLDRARSIPASGRFMIVDSATQRLTLYENAQPVDSMKVIVGTTKLPTPLIASTMYYVTFNPYWHSPDHLVRKTIAPTVLRQGLGYLKRNGYHILEEWSETSTTIDPATIDWKAAAAGTLHLKIRQDPGPINSMGILKFPFANPEDIYLHDTPGKGLFAKDTRDLSNGCVRVEDARRLGRWLLGQEPVAPGSDPETRVKIPEGVPIILTYLTAQVRDGRLTYLTDIYGWDSPGSQQLATIEKPVS
jgi:murein L,D-transpeptidase YcbB/YkuD